LLKVVRPKRLYEQIAEQITAMIVRDEIGPGARLPGERELAELLGVSRPSVREALVALETSGLIEVRVGDGAVVCSKADQSRAFSLSMDADLGPGPVEQFQARRAIEPECAALAARLATAAQLDGLEASVARIEACLTRGESPREEHRTFHVLLAESSQNTILAGVVRELWRLRQLEMWDTLRKRVETLSSFKVGLAFRRRVVACLRDHDAKGAEQEMKKHFARVGRMYFDLKPRADGDE
jgi:DNA-binding FadR family transcriptional regulator